MRPHWILLLGLGCTSAFALIECPMEFPGTATINLATRLPAGGIDAPISTPDGQCAGDAGTVAQLFRVEGAELIPAHVGAAGKHNGQRRRTGFRPNRYRQSVHSGGGCGLNAGRLNPLHATARG